MRLIAVALFVAACSATAADPSASPSPTPGSVLGRTFLSTAVTRDGAPFPLAPGSQLRISFTSGQLTASAGCNTISGGFGLAGNVLVVNQLGTTEMACNPPALMTQEQWFAGVLNSRPTLALDGDNLTLSSAGTVIRLLDKVVAQPPAELVGPLWTVDTIIAGESASSVPAGVTATIQFDANGGVTLNTGCNSGGGKYSIEGDRIAFSDLVTTKRACSGSANVLEMAVMDVLRAGTATYSIDGQALTLSAGAAGLQLSAP